SFCHPDIHISIASATIVRSLALTRTGTVWGIWTTELKIPGFDQVACTFKMLRHFRIKSYTSGMQPNSGAIFLTPRVYQVEFGVRNRLASASGWCSLFESAPRFKGLIS